MVEREKQMGIKRLVETGRMIDPSEYVKRPKKKKKYEPRKLVSDDGKVRIEE